MAASCFKLTIPLTEADFMRAAWVKKVQDLLVVPGDEGVTVFFRSPLTLLNIRRKACEQKKGAIVTLFEEEEWVSLRAAAGISTTGQLRNYAIT